MRSAVGIAGRPGKNGSEGYHDQLTAMCGAPVIALAVGGTVRTAAERESLLVWKDLSHAATGTSLMRFRHALQMELAHLSAVARFEDGASPVYRDQAALDLVAISAVLDLERVLCFVVQVADQVFAARQYEGADVMLLSDLSTQLRLIASSVAVGDEQRQKS